MARVWNFAAGPAVLPLAVLASLQRDMTDYQGKGMSVMEMSHRSKMYLEIYDHAEASLRKLMHIPENYRVLFLQGGATLQFAGVPLNLMARGSADYLDTGSFAHGAAVEAKKYGEVRIVASSREANYTYIPDIPAGALNPDADYCYITTNNTIFGTRFPTLPETGDVPLVADMSSNILSEPYDVSKFGVIFAGAQKNIGPAGVTVVIVREDLLGRAQKHCPKIMDWKLEVAADSMLNTPCTFGIYVAGLCFDWLLAKGGVEGIAQQNIDKAQALYDYLDESRLFSNAVRKDCRSRMNVTFTTGSADMDDAFCKQATAAGLANLKGHRLVGGMRASIYNAMEPEGVQALITFMKQFESANA